MKRIFGLVWVLSSMALWAQPAPPTPVSSEIRSLTGSLEVVQGRIGIRTDGTSYILSGISQLVGFVDDLKEGAAVTVEGFSAAPPMYDGIQVFRVVRLTIGESVYEIPAIASHTEGRRQVFNYRSDLPEGRIQEFNYRNNLPEGKRQEFNHRNDLPPPGPNNREYYRSRGNCFPDSRHQDSRRSFAPRRF
jgi:hypothetical protein